MILPTEMAFRANLLAGEQEMEELRKTVNDLKHQNKLKDKATMELRRLKGIIAAQDEKVRVNNDCLEMELDFNSMTMI